MSKPIQITSSMRIVACINGVKLVNSSDPRHPDGLLINDFLQLPFSVYFLNNQGETILINPEGATVCGFGTSETSVGKSLHHVSQENSAYKLIDNCHEVINTGSTKIFEEENVRQDGVSMQFLSVKMPWYDDDEKIIGVMGASIVLGKHSLSDALSKLSVFGFLNKNKFIRMDDEKSLKKKDVHLTARELECLQGAVKGKTSKKIAKELGISFRTVEEYLRNIRQKMGANSKSELIEMTVENFYSKESS